jgi:hypothetical protein
MNIRPQPGGYSPTTEIFTCSSETVNPLFVNNYLALTV